MDNLAINPSRFWARVDQSDPNGCWPWKGKINDSGYGVTTRRALRVHRVAFILAGGVIPNGYQIDHVKDRGCTRRDCCNPAHLEAVTPKVNSERSTCGEVNRARMLARTHCKRGHEFNQENTHISPIGVRICRACKRDWAKRLYWEKKAI